MRKRAFLLTTVTGQPWLWPAAMHDTNSPCFLQISVSVRSKHWKNHYSLLQDIVFTRYLFFVTLISANLVSDIQGWHYPSPYNSYLIGKCKSTWVFFFPLLPSWSAVLQCMYINKHSQAYGMLSVATIKDLRKKHPVWAVQFCNGICFPFRDRLIPWELSVYVLLLSHVKWFHISKPQKVVGKQNSCFQVRYTNKL